MAIDAYEHTTHLHAADDMLDPLSDTRQDTIVLALLNGQRRRTRRLVGGDGMPWSDPPRPDQEARHFAPVSIYADNNAEEPVCPDVPIAVSSSSTS
jgi:hypothetical protein